MSEQEPLLLHVRIQGRVRGPYDLDKLRSLVRRGELGRMHEVSSDRVNWQKASEFSEIFDLSELTSSTAQKVAANRPAVGQTPSPTPSPQSQPIWHYAVGDREYGPLTLATLQSKFLSGDLNGEADVWCQGMPDWVPASTRPDLFSTAARNRLAVPHVEEDAQSHAQATVTHEVVRMLGESRPWVMFISICGFVIAVELIFFGIVFLIISGEQFDLAQLISRLANAAQQQRSSLIAAGILSMIWAIVPVLGGACLMVYQGRIGWIVRTRSEKRLVSALRVLRTFWVFVGISLVVVLAMSAYAGVELISELFANNVK